MARSIFRNGAAGAANSQHELMIPSKACSDNVATDLLTISIPNAAHSARLTLELLGASGGSDASESARAADAVIEITRTAGVATVATVNTLEQAGTSTVGGGDTFSLSVAASSMTGATSAAQTFTVQVTLNSAGGQALVCMGSARLMNLNGGPGITMALA